VERALSIASALAMVLLAALVTWKSSPRVAGARAAPPEPIQVDAGAGPNPSPKSPVSEGVDAAAAPPSDVPAVAADKPGDVPGTGPKRVRLGVILVSYAGAQDGPDKGRSKAEALALATRLADDAKTDFHAAAQRGDSGSSDDIGVVTRGVLEPGLEATLFALPVKTVSEAIDTPRGYWIVKRLE
jgi:hypothetical protein